MRAGAALARRDEFGRPSVPPVTPVYDLVIVSSHQPLWSRSRLRFLLVSAGIVLTYLALHLVPCSDGHAEASAAPVAAHEVSVQFDEPGHHPPSSDDCDHAGSGSDPHDETCVATSRPHGGSDAIFLALPLVAGGWGLGRRSAPVRLLARGARRVVPRPGQDVLRSCCVSRR
ncbi:hypothetical protein [Jiangella muralis]|uniref:hypothetical protein n=1 Tax=Jiangella muralis TaxID=702383 RepID=UPI00069F1E24|nr:hypothetical protein [Jiangella muralis]